MDARLGEVMAVLKPRDMLVVTADHGNDPTTPSTDHAREYVPVFVAVAPSLTVRDALSAATVGAEFAVAAYVAR